MAVERSTMYRVFSLLFVAFTVNAKSYNLFDHCDAHLDVYAEGEIYLQVSSSEYLFTTPTLCNVVFFTTAGLQLSFYVEDLDLDDCHSGDHLQIYDGSVMPTKVLTNQLCKEEGMTIRTSSDVGVVSYYSPTPTSHRSASFRISVNVASSTGNCGNDFFYCKPKALCLQNNLKCNDEDDCGDESDEEDCGLAWWIILVICFAVFVIIAIVVAAVCVCASSKGSKKGQVHHQSTAPLSTVAASAPAPDPWGFKTAQSVPSVPPTSFTHTLTGQYGPRASEQGTGDLPPSYSSLNKDPLPALKGVPPPAVYNLPLSYN